MYLYEDQKKDYLKYCFCRFYSYNNYYLLSLCPSDKFVDSYSSRTYIHYVSSFILCSFTRTALHLHKPVLICTFTRTGIQKITALLIVRAKLKCIMENNTSSLEVEIGGHYKSFRWQTN